MGLIAFIGLNVLLLLWILALLTVKKERDDLFGSIRRHPFSNLFFVVWLICVMAFGWGAISAGHLSLPIHTYLGTIQSWQLGAIGMVIGLPVLDYVKID